MQIPPHIVLNPINAEVAVGGSVAFSCNATGYPPLEIFWLKNDVKVQMTGNFLNPNTTITTTTIQLSTNLALVAGVLSIEQVDLTDAGDYSCLATNLLNETMSDTSVGALLSVKCKF